MNYPNAEFTPNASATGHTLDIEFVVHGDWHTPPYSLDEERTQARSDAIQFANSYDSTHQRLHEMLELATGATILHLPVGLGSGQSEDGANYCQLISVELSNVQVSKNKVLADVWTAEAATRLDNLFQQCGLASEVTLALRGE